ncbi:MAG: transcription repressor NadR [Thermosipho sp. (in: Bacteria)]|nr:transcription repressor NadR [Thermosipho sp. (in: thermotogales)]
MKGNLKKIIEILSNSSVPMKGRELAEMLGVSRQAIVQYVSILKTKGYKIFSTRDGYILENTKGKIRKMVAVKHNSDEIYNELLSIVNAGGKVIDIIVEHPIYGEIRGRLDIASNDDVSRFIALMESTHATPLLELSGGVHIHTIEAPDRKTMENVLRSIEKYLIKGVGK